VQKSVMARCNGYWRRMAGVPLLWFWMTAIYLTQFQPKRSPVSVWN